ncbi:MAG: hypothetical protein R3F59_04395 [Myxococcota bacterium]
MWGPATLLSLGLAPASAQDAACDAVLLVSEWDEGMDAADEALAALDGARAERILDDVVEGVRCLGEPRAAGPGRAPGAAAPPCSRSSRRIPKRCGSGGCSRARRSAGTPWPDDVRVPDRFFTLLDAMPDPAVARAEGGLAVPKGGGALLDEVPRHRAHRDARGRAPAAGGRQAGPDRVQRLAGRRLLRRALAVRRREAPAVPKWYDPPLPLRPAPPPRPRPCPCPCSLPLPLPAPAPDPAPQPSPDPQPQPQPQPQPAPVPEVHFDGDGRWPDCTWQQDPQDVQATGRLVRIEGVAYPVRRSEDQAAFKKALRSCGEFRAARRFTRWRKEHAKLFVSGNRYRDAMLEALKTPEPKPKRRKPKKPAP